MAYFIVELDPCVLLLMQIDILRDECVKAAILSLASEGASAAWAAHLYTVGSNLGISSLREWTFAHIVLRAMSDASYLGPTMEVLAQISSSPPEQLASIFNGLERSYSMGCPTSIVAVLLLRMDQLADGGQPASQKAQERKRARSASPASREGLDLISLLQEVDFNQMQPAELRALKLMAISCSTETPVLVLLMRRLLQAECAKLPPQDAAVAYQAAGPGAFVTGTLDTSTEIFTNPRELHWGVTDGPFVDLASDKNRLFGKEEGASSSARLHVQYVGAALVIPRGPTCYLFFHRSNDDAGSSAAFGIFVSPANGKCFKDAGIRSYAFYCIPSSVATGVLIHGPVAPGQDSRARSTYCGNPTLVTNWRAHFEAGAQMMVGVFLCQAA